MFDVVAEFNMAFFHFVVFAIIVTVCAGFTSRIIQGVFHVIVSRIKPPSPEQTCAYCPRRRRKGHVSCPKCGKSLQT